MSTAMVQPKSKLNRSGISRIFQVGVTVLLIAGLLFGGAGRLDWWQAWAFLGIYLAGIGINAAWTINHDPAVINERGQMAENTKRWDEVISLLYALMLIATFIVAGLDARFGWSTLPVWLNLLGGLGLAVTLALVFWVMSANPFLSNSVRIQAERGQYVVSSGPYRYVRHPMYASHLILFWAAPVLLGSWWALVPCALHMVVLIIRTVLEDRMLHTELPGYADYARRVRYRLVPGVW